MRFRWLRRLWFRCFPRYQRLELRTANYVEADRLIRSTAYLPEPERWRLAIPEEDRDHAFNVVYLERRVRIWE